MSITTLGLLLIVSGYAIFLIYDGYIQANRFGKTIVGVRLRRRLVDAIFFSFIVVGGLYYEFTHDNNWLNITSLIALMALALYHGLRFPKWRLKKNGFTAGGRYWSYDAINAMRLSEDGVLVLTLNNGYNVILPVAYIDDLEKAAAFFAGEDALKHLTPQHKESR